MLDETVIHTRLTNHLRDVVRADIAGRSDSDLVDLRKPYNSIFAGVLKSARYSDVERADKPEEGSSAGGSLGLYFKVASSEPVSLKIRGRCFVYYAVFPTYAQLQQQRAMTSPSEIARMPDEGVSGDPVQVESASLEPSSEDQDDLEDVSIEDETEGDEDGPQTPPESDTTIQPVWRRAEIAVLPLAVDVARSSSPTSVAESALAEAVTQVHKEIATDPLRWRHLGKEGKGERTLNVATIGSEEDYRQALAGVLGEAAPFPPWKLRLTVQASPDLAGEGLGVTVIFSNETPGVDKEREWALYEHAVFDAGIEVDLGRSDLMPMEFHLAPEDYRLDRRMPARGINCAAVWDEEQKLLRTETLPVYEQPLMRTRDELLLPFAELAGDGPFSQLEQVRDAMMAYEDEWESYLRTTAMSALTEDQRTACRDDLSQFMGERRAFEAGIAALRADAHLLRSFQLMNHAFQVLADTTSSPVRSWRMFQLVFICINLASLAARDKSLRTDALTRVTPPELSEVSVLWFPTGGGKTEAYLGLIAAAIIYDRLRGKKRGVTAWMRFPLRMLSLQQVERLSRVIAVLNRLRASQPDIAEGDPIAIGYLVGDTTTPNSVDHSLMMTYERDSYQRDKLKMLRRCPFCESEVQIKVLRDQWRLAHVCVDPDCFSNTSNSMGVFKGSLPISVVDREIYRLLPAVLVGTVDKLAIIGHNSNFSQVLWSARQVCPVHGYASFGKCLEGNSAGCSAKLVKLSPEEYTFDAPPSLLLQDEFHLLASELGAFDGHYESLLDFICRQISLPPKLLAATATVADYQSQAFHVYLKAARRFPQPGWLHGESFYATSSPLMVRRQFVGVANHVPSPVTVSIRLLAAYQKEIYRLQGHLSDFRDIVGEPSLPDEEIHRVLRLHDLSVVYVTKKEVGQAIRDKTPEIDKALYPEHVDLNARVLTGDQPIEEVGDTIDQVTKERDDLGPDRLNILLATSIISHGVDLERINMLVMAGIPSHYAEYLQATSRCARSQPGLVFSCFNGRDPRERSQFEFFLQMHRHVDRLIESVPVNRFASNAPIKTVPGLTSGLLKSYYGPSLLNARSIDRPLDNLLALRVALGLQPGHLGQCLQRDDILQTIAEIIGVDRSWPLVSQAEVDLAAERVALEFEYVYGRIEREHGASINDILTILTSFRDIDTGIDFGSMKSLVLLQAGDRR